MKYLITIYILLSFLGISGQEKLVNIDIGDTIPDIVLRDIHDRSEQTVELRQLSNEQLVIIDFWATWCGACLASMPNWTVSPWSILMK